MFRYVPLPPLAESGRTPPYTRILHLEAGGGEDPFCGRLEIVSLEAAPPYEALSYTWGKDAPSNYIWIQGHPLPIQPNLEGALHALRPTTGVRRLWIDALCIDQSNTQERSRQVLYMRLVYQHCAGVVVWLGPKTDGVDAAFELAQRLANMGRLLEEGPVVNGKRERLDPETLNDLVGNAMGGLPQNAMQNLQTVFEREYFSRCWVVQEIMVGNRPKALCGDLEVPFFDLVSVLFFLSNYRDKVNVSTPLDIWHLIYSKHNDKSPVKLTDVEGSLGPLMDLLESMRDFKATDPRDKVYSLIGICDEGIQPIMGATHITRETDRRLSGFHRIVTRVQNAINEHNPQLEFGIPAALKPDYNKDVVDVYIDIARYSITKMPKFLDILSYVEHHTDPSETGLDGFPSWVPKWYEGKAFHVFRGGKFTAGICRPSVSDLVNPRIPRALAHPRHLVIDGFQVGIIHQVSDVFKLNRKGDDRVDAIQSYWSQIFPFPMVPRRNQSYFSGEPLDVAFCKAISASPQGTLYGSMLTDATMGYSFDNPTWTREILEELSQRCINSFLAYISGQLDNSPERQREIAMFTNAVAVYGQNRRAFITSDGRLGLCPTFTRVGDEVTVLFRGRMPYVLRRQSDHHILMGDCYIRDDDIMFGKTTEAVRHGRGGPPTFLYEIR